MSEPACGDGEAEDVRHLDADWQVHMFACRLGFFHISARSKFDIERNIGNPLRRRLNCDCIERADGQGDIS